MNSKEDGSFGRPAIIGTDSSSYAGENLSPVNTMDPSSDLEARALAVPVPGDGYISSLTAPYTFLSTATVGPNASITVEVYVSSPPSNTFTSTGVSVVIPLDNTIARGETMTLTTNATTGGTSLPIYFNGTVAIT